VVVLARMYTTSGCHCTTPTNAPVSVQLSLGVEQIVVDGGGGVESMIRT